MNNSEVIKFDLGVSLEILNDDREMVMSFIEAELKSLRKKHGSKKESLSIVIYDIERYMPLEAVASCEEFEKLLKEPCWIPYH